MARKSPEIKIRIRYYKEDGTLGDYDDLSPEDKKIMQHKFTQRLADAVMGQKGYTRVEKEDIPPDVYKKYFGTNTG